MLVFFEKKPLWFVCAIFGSKKVAVISWQRLEVPRHWCPVHIRSSSRHYFSAPCGNWDLTTSMTRLGRENFAILSAWGIQDASKKKHAKEYIYICIWKKYIYLVDSNSISVVLIKYICGWSTSSKSMSQRCSTLILGVKTTNIPNH